MSEGIRFPWRCHTGPFGWFRIRFPAAWELREEDDVTHLVTRNGASTLTLSCLWLPHAGDLDLRALVDVNRELRQARNVRRLKPPELPYHSLALEGESLDRAGAAWWQRLLGIRGKRPWRMWAIQQGPVCLLASFEQRGTQDPELQAVASMIVNTIEMAASPADPPGIFAERVLQLARDRFPLVECRHGEDFQLRMGESNLNLFNFYRSYMNSPERFEEIMLPALTTIVQVQEWGAKQTEPRLEDVRSRIMPMLYPEDVWHERFEGFVGAPWVGGLVILYVVDESQAYWYIRRELLDQWQLTHDELHELALENLDAYFETAPVESVLAGGDGGPRLLLPSRPDAYNAARVLSRPFYRAVREYLGGEFIVGMPSRDFCLAASLESPEMLAALKSRVAEDHSQMDHPLSERLFLVSADGVSEYCGDMDET